MGKVQIHENRGGGGNSLGLQKLWEGDVHLTGSTDDLTGGAVDPAQCAFLLVVLTGTLTSEKSDTYYGLGKCYKGSLSTYDFSGSKTDVLISRSYLMSYQYNSRSWGTYNPDTNGNANTGWRTEKPFLFAGREKDSSKDITSGFTADFHFAVYGIKL